MAVSSPTSSCDSFRSSSFSSSNFSSLPVMPQRRRIVEKILENRVTLIVGETGCGKSSQVPQFLLEENMAPILCTQPRRFAVVAVAKMVAKARNCELGGEVGYHIGHSKVLSEGSKIIFKTAGVLLDEMHDKGLNALKYKAIILDEVHERSVESDLVLVCVKQFLMRNHDLRLVLMSATADVTRYRDYFKDLGRGERVEVLAIPSSDQKTIFQRRVLYLEQVTRLLGMSSELSTYCPGPSPSTANPEINPEVERLIYDLILHIHNNEPDIEKSILVFLPTYYSLEQQWYLLEPLSTCFKVHILHRSIDTEQALAAMRICKSRRKVILATNIAESSVTIPKVAYVIDSCRSLQVFWDATKKKDSTELVWVSRSQAGQRGGRTGRTCDGEVYRLVPSSFFNKLEEYESPAIIKLSLRQQVLQICCTESKAINDPRGLLAKAMDPPNPAVIEDALNVLLNMRALRRSPRGRYEPTFYGRVLASFPLSFDASILVVKFGEMGMLREGILLGAMMDTQPLPIVHPFGDDALFLEYVHYYFSGDGSKTILGGRREVVLMANLCAFQFWQRVFKDKHRLEHLKQLLVVGKAKDVRLMFPEIEQEWCDFHNIVQSSLYHVSEIYEDIIGSLHRFRPKFLSFCDAQPTYYKSYEFEHTCYLECQPREDTHPHLEDEDDTEPVREVRKCVSVPFVTPNDFQVDSVARNMANIVKEIRMQNTQDLSDNEHRAIGGDGNADDWEVPVCVYFVKGFCNRGSSCVFSHTLQSKRPLCKFFSSLQGCRNGDSCLFSHDLQRQVAAHPTAPCLPEDNDSHTTPLLELFPVSSDGCILVVDDTDLHFTSSIADHYESRKILTTSSLSETLICSSSLRDARIFWGLHHPYQTIISKAGENPISWNEVKCVLWFLNPDSYGESSERQKLVVQNFFEYMAIRILGDALYEIQVVLTMNNIKFSHLQVEKLGRECFFFLTDSFPHDETRFGEFSDTFSTQKPMFVSKPISYVFDLHPPTDIQFGDYASVLHKALHSS